MTDSNRISNYCPEMPWDPLNFEGYAEGEEFKTWALTTSGRIEDELYEEGARECNADWMTEKAKRLFAEMTATTCPTGLGLSYGDIPPNRLPRNPVQVFNEREANCLEFTSFFLGAAALAGISAVPIALRGFLAEHVLIGITDPDTGEIKTRLDTAGWDLDVPWEVFSQRQFLGHYYNSMAALENNPSLADYYMNRAYELNPTDYIISLNTARFAEKKGDFDMAVQFALASFRDYDHYEPYKLLFQIARKTEDPDLLLYAMRGLTPERSLYFATRTPEQVRSWFAIFDKREAQRGR